MNKQELSKMFWESRNMLKNKGYVKEGAILFSYGKAESWEHYLAKCIVVRMLKEGVTIPEVLNIFREEDYVWGADTMWDFMGHITYPFRDIEYEKMEKLNLKTFEIPKIYTEADFGEHEADVFVASSLEGRAVVEIIDTESEESIEKKRAFFESKGIKLYEVRI